MARLVAVDHFKRINDTHGHAAGDLVLIELAALLAVRLRETDRAGRLGGELRITASLGVASLAPGDTDVNALLHRADMALYQAKRAGRNRVA